MRSAIATALRDHKHAALLVLLLAAVTVQSFDALPGAGGLFSNVMRSALGLATLFVVFQRPRERAAMAVVLVVTAAIGWLRDGVAVGHHHALGIALHALMAVFLWAAVVVILRDLFRSPMVGAESVFGAICGYLLAGDAWAGVNAIAYLLDPSAYSISPDVTALLADWHGRIALFSYYGFAQMLTIGYSDVTPVRAPATTLSLLGALFGLFYTAIVVSQFVGLMQAAKPERAGEP